MHAAVLAESLPPTWQGLLQHPSHDASGSLLNMTSSKCSKAALISAQAPCFIEPVDQCFVTMQGHDAMHLSVLQGDTATAAVLLQHSAENPRHHANRVCSFTSNAADMTYDAKQ